MSIFKQSKYFKNSLIMINTIYKYTLYFMTKLHSTCYLVKFQEPKRQSECLDFSMATYLPILPSAIRNCIQ